MHTRWIAVALFAAAGGTPAVAGAAGDAQAPQYQVDCPEGATSARQCEVGRGTYQGWRTYSSTCLHCHGAGGLGSTFAPDLLRRLEHRGSFGHFKDVVLNGYRGQMGVMQGFAKDKRVRENVDNLYRYLTARSEGALPNGRPPEPGGGGSAKAEDAR